MPSLSVRLRLDVSATLNMTDKKMVSFRAKPEESRGNEPFGLFSALPRDVATALRLLNMTENFEVLCC